MAAKARRKRKPKKLPPIYVECAACGEEIEIADILRLGDAHPDICAARPVLLRLDSDSHGNWFPIIQSHEGMTDADRARIRDQVKEMIADFERRA